LNLNANPLAAFDLGLGTWQWGDQFVWGYGRGYAAAEVRAAFDAAQAAGITLFDTAEVYGLGRSEKFLGGFIRATSAPAFIATKFFPMPWRWDKGALRRALRGSLKRLGVARVDLYQIHWPFRPVPIETWMAALADAVEAGEAKAVGVSNYSPAQTRRAYAALKARGVPLASNQVSYSLLNREIERNGLLELCQALGIRVIAYSPLAMGLLSGKYSTQHPPPVGRHQRYGAVLERLPPLIAALTEIGAAHGNKTPAQTALNWCICKGTLPIPGAKNARQAEQNAGALGWRLTEAEIAELDRVSEAVTSGGRLR
jgi:aryl-alcohol dehydrogenase-like predicted oxidoreductase